MSFNTSVFLLYFFPLFLLIYFIAPIKLKNAVALLASVLFYIWASPKFIGIIFFVLIADFWLGQQIYGSAGVKRKRYLIASVMLNLSFLFYFKYFNFFVGNLDFALQGLGFHQTNWTKVALPLGISFFTFQEMSYTIDIFRGKHKPLKKFTDYALFILMFSHIVAGPIITYDSMVDDILDRKKKLNNDYRLQGLMRFFIGLAKKVLIANNIGLYVDQVFQTPINHLSSGDCWLAGIAFTFQIYYDFAGYSDMAIGIGKLMGFDFPTNFNFPFTSKSFAEFWQRWNITLGAWLREYLYIPLGGNRVSPLKHYINLLIVFEAVGLWHGASWADALVGLYFGSLIILEAKLLARILNKVPVALRMFYVFFIFMIGMIDFRANNLDFVYAFYGKMFSFHGLALTAGLIPDAKFIFCICVGFLFSIVAANKYLMNKLNQFYEVNVNPVAFSAKIMACTILFILCLSEIASSTFTPFIYFKF